MRSRQILTWSAAVGAGAAIAGAEKFIHDMRKPPIINAFYVALGSSFAAGPGLGARVPGSPIISQRSINSYPQQLARLLEVPSFTDMTSSGATVQQVLHGGQMLLGPQVAALGPETRLVTLTAGGNDVAYVGDLTAMAWRNHGGIIGSMVNGFWKGAKSIEQRDFDGLGMNLRATLRDIKARAPLAEIVVATYPTILPPAGTCACLGLSAEQAVLMRSVGERLAEVTRDAAASQGVRVVDIAALSAGHDACGPQPWVHGFRPKTGATFHPTLEGARATASAIALAIL